MRNLKKILALVLALAMSLSLVTIASGIDLGDAEDIDHTEAVEVLSTLGVIQGYEDGNYYPDRVVKRSEMAKMITYILTGGKEPVLDSSNVSFGDTKGHWAAGYIEYCAAQGILNGYEDGNFYPERTVTASEAAKMILVAMNYDSSVFGFTGAGWAVNVAVEANKAGLYDELLGTNPSDGLDRDSTAQMLYNGITSATMRLQYNHNIATGEVTQSYTLTGPSLLEDKFDASIEIGVLTSLNGNSKGFVVRDLDNGTTTIVNGNTVSYHSNISNSDYAEDLSSLLGEEVRVIVRNNTSKNAVLGVYATGTSQVAYTTWNAIKADTTDSTEIAFGGKSYEIELPNATTAATADHMLVNGSDRTASYFTNEKWNSPVKLVDIDGNGKYDIAYVTTTQMAKVTYVGKDNINVSLLGSNRSVLSSTSQKLEDVTVYDGIAKDDYVVVYKGAFTGKLTYDEAAVATGTISGVKTVDGVEQFLIDGTWYEAAAGVSLNLDAGDVVDYVADAGLIYAAEVTSGATGVNSLAMIITADQVKDFSDTDSGLAQTVVKAKLLFADGSKKTVTISKMNSTDDSTLSTLENAVIAEIGEMVAFNIDADGNYELSTIAASTAGSSLPVRGFDGSGSNNAYSNETIGGIELADDAVVFALTSGSKGSANASNDGKVYTGKEFKNTYGNATFGTATDTASSLYVTENGFRVAKAAAVIGNPSITSGSNYGYLVADSYRSVIDGKTYQNYSIFNGESTLTVRQENGPVVKAGTVISYDVVSDTEVKNVNIPLVTTGAVTGWDGSRYISLDNSSRLEINQDTTIIYVDSANKAASEGSIAIADKPDGTTYQDNVRYLVSGNNVLLLLVDTNNKMDDAPAYALGSDATKTSIEDALAKNGTVTINSDLSAAAAGLNVAAGQTLNITAAQTKVHTVTVAAGGTLNITGLMAATSSVTAQPGANVTVQGRDIVGGTGLTSTADITVKALASGNTEITLAAAATLNGGTLEVTEGDKLTGAFEVRGTNGAKIVVYKGTHTSNFAWTIAQLTINVGAENADSVASAATLPAAANQVYTWSTGDDTAPLSGWVVSARS